MSLFLWVELDFFSLECNALSGSEFWGVYGFGMIWGSLSFNVQFVFLFCSRKIMVAQMVKRLSTMWETRVRSLGQEDPLEKEMAIHSSTIAWKIL